MMLKLLMCLDCALVNVAIDFALLIRVFCLPLLAFSVSRQCFVSFCRMNAPTLLLNHGF